MADKEIKLPSGKAATVKDGKGRDLLAAQRKAKTQEEVMFALMAELVLLDGQPVIYEDLLEMDLKDVLAILTEVSGNFLSLPLSS